MADLQCLPPAQQPHVSDHMEQIKDMIPQIESNGCAYRVDGNVYFLLIIPQIMAGYLDGSWKKIDPVNGLLLIQENEIPLILLCGRRCKIVKDALSVFREGRANEVAESRGKTVCITDAAQECIFNLRNDVKKMSDDLHAFSVLNSGLPEALKLMNSSLSLLKKKQQRQKQLSVVQSLTELEKEVRVALDFLVLLSGLGYSEVLEQLKNKALKRSGFGDDYIESQIEERALARNNKDFCRGDKIRSDLAAKGIGLMDVGSETIWRPCVPVQQEQPCGPEHAKPCMEA